MTSASIRHLILTGLLALAACSNATSPSATAEPKKDTDTKTKTESVVAEKYVDGYLELFWEDLMPPGEEEKLLELYYQMQSSMFAFSVEEGSPGDKANQVGTFNVVPELDGKKIRLPGYTVPLGSADNFTEFLLVPTLGACLHQPPPPPNQTLYVKSKKPIKSIDLAQAVWVSGTLKTQIQKTDRADTAYILELDKFVEYEY